MLAPYKTTLADLPTTFEVPNIIGAEHREGFFDMLYHLRKAQCNLFLSDRSAYSTDPIRRVGQMTDETTSLLRKSLPKVQAWFIGYLRDEQPRIDTYSIDNTVRQIEDLVGLLVREAWMTTETNTKPFRGEIDFLPLGQSILLEANKCLVLFIQAFRDWAEEARWADTPPGRVGGKPKAPKGRKKRAGRPQKYCPEDDEQLVDRWKSTSMTRDEFEVANGLNAGAIQKAQGRIYYRQKRATE